MGAMRRATAVHRLRAIAERCQQVCHLWEPDSGLVGVQTFGGVLDPSDEDGSIEVIQIVLVVQEDPEQVTWCSRPPTFSGLPYVLDLEKAPVDWYYRPAAHPVGNHRIVRPLPIWSREDGVHEAALEALAARDADALDRLREDASRPVVLQRQLAEELAAASAHLQRVRDQYWARGWRTAHHVAGTCPENYLWDAVNGYLDLLAAAEGLPGGAVATGPGRAAPRRPAVAAPAPADPAEPPPVLPVLLDLTADPVDPVDPVDPEAVTPEPSVETVAAAVAEPVVVPGPAVVAESAVVVPEQVVVVPETVAVEAEPGEAVLAAVSARGTARRTRRATGPARRRGTRDASPGS
jgi:hypothetical protein